MEKQDWDEAATFIHQASLLDPAIVNGPFAMSAVPSSEIPDPPTVYLSQASDALFKLFLREFDAAAKVKDEKRITRFFRLFPLIGKEQEGLDVYGRFVCGIIAGRSRAAMTQREFLVKGLFSDFSNIISNVLCIDVDCIIREYRPNYRDAYSDCRPILRHGENG